MCAVFSLVLALTYTSLRRSPAMFLLSNFALITPSCPGVYGSFGFSWMVVHPQLTDTLGIIEGLSPVFLACVWALPSSTKSFSHNRCLSFVSACLRFVPIYVITISGWRGAFYGHIFRCLTIFTNILVFVAVCSPISGSLWPKMSRM